MIKIFEDGIERDATEAEIAQLEKDAATEAKLNAKRQADAKANAEAKAALLDRLGITEDEARLLLG
jgi:hypothetical protein